MTEEEMTATVAAVLFTVGRSPIPVSQRIEALEQAADTLRKCEEEVERAELELLWLQS